MKVVTENDKIVAKKALSFFDGKPVVYNYANADETKEIDIMHCDNKPYDGMLSISTLGLWKTDIGSTAGGKPLRVELLGACDIRDECFGNILSTASFLVMDYKHASPGTIIPDIVSMFVPNSDMKHILLTYPFVWDVPSYTLALEDMVVTWLMAVPISDEEREYCNKYGLDALEDVFEEKRIDILDLYRKNCC